MAAWTSRGMDKFLCEDFGLSSINNYGKFISSGKNIYKIAFLSETDKTLRIWKYNIKENLPWKEISSFFCPIPSYIRVEVSEVVVRGQEIFVFLRQQFGKILYNFIPIFDIKKETWSVPPYQGYEVPDLQRDSVNRGTCLVGDDFLIYSSASFDNYYDFRPPDQGGTDRYSDTQDVPPHENPIRFYSFNLPSREWRCFDTHMIGFKKADILRIGQVFFCSALMSGSDEKSVYLFNERAFHHDSKDYSRLNVAYKLDCEKKEWRKIRVTGDIPDKVQTSATLKGFVYLYGCSGEPKSPSAGSFDRSLLMCDIFRFDCSRNHWDLIDAAGPRPEPRANATLLPVDDKIVLIGGMGGRGLARRRRSDEFWYRGNRYDLGCRCNYCWDMELTGEEDIGAFESEEEEEERERGVVIGKSALQLGKGEETRACFDSAAEFSNREIAIGEEQVRQELENREVDEEGIPTDILIDDFASISVSEAPSIQLPIASVAAPVEANIQVQIDDAPVEGEMGIADGSTDQIALNVDAPAQQMARNLSAPVDQENDILAATFEETLRNRFREIPRVKLTKEEMDSVRFKFFFWQTKNDPLASPYFFDIHVLDLSPSLKTMALMSIADSIPRVDTSYLPPNLHLNLNTMYAFDPEGKKMPALSESEWEMLVYGKGDFRWDVVKTLKEIGAYDGGIFKLFMMEKFLEREQA